LSPKSRVSYSDCTRWTYVEAFEHDGFEGIFGGDNVHWIEKTTEYEDVLGK